jgi:hypothetical protein
MIWKLLTLAMVALTVWGAARKVLGAGVPARPPAPSKGRGAVDMVRCGRCGGWIAPGESCGCETPPLP